MKRLQKIWEEAKIVSETLALGRPQFLAHFALLLAKKAEKQVKKRTRPTKEEREHIIPVEGHENALFLSLQNRRIAVRSVENHDKQVLFWSVWLRLPPGPTMLPLRWGPDG